MEVPWLSDSDIRTAARELLMNCFGSGSPGLPIDLDEIVYEHLYARDDLRFSDEEDLGTDDDGDEILGKMLPRAQRILVTSRLKEHRSVGRYRFTVAHEIGHWELHRGYMLAYSEAPSLFSAEPQAVELVSYRRSVFPPPGARIGAQERQANRFAIALLAEPVLLREHVELRFGPLPIYRSSAAADLRGGNLEEFAWAVSSVRVNKLPALKEVFGLSRQAMGIALREFGFVAEFKQLL